MTEKRIYVDPALLEAVSAKNELRNRFMDPFLSAYNPIFGISASRSSGAEIVVHLREELPEDLRERLAEGIGVNVRFDVDRNNYGQMEAPAALAGRVE